MSILNETTLAEIDDILNYEVAQRHSYFQLKYFIIGKEPTIQSKMWQCLRELKTRRESLASIDLEMEDTKDNIELIDISIEKIKRSKPVNKLNQRENTVKIRKSERQKKSYELTLDGLVKRKKYIGEETFFFLETFKNLLKIESLKNFDDFDAQKEYWGEKLSQKLNLKMLTQNALDTEMIETIMSLPDEMQIKQQTMNTLAIRHANLTKQFQETMKNIETKKDS